MSTSHQQEQPCLSRQATERSREINIPKQEVDFRIDCLPRHLWSWSTSVEHSHHELQALVIDYESDKVLLRREGQRWVLPGFWAHNENYEQILEPSTMLTEVEKLAGATETLAFLRPLWKSERKVRINDCTCALEKRVVLIETTSSFVPVGREYEWVKFQDAYIYHLFEDAANAVREVIQWALNGYQPPKLPVWQRPGWSRFAMSWMEDVFDRQCNVGLTQPLLVECSSAYGVVLRAQTKKGRFFLKCTSPLANDAAYTDALSDIVPRFVAKPIVVNRDKQMMVTADYGEILRVGFLSTEEEEGISRDYARLQKGTIGRTEELIDAGFPDLRPLKLLEYIDKLPFDSTFQALGDAEECAPFVRFFCENREGFKNALRELIESDIPATVTHNDLAFTNMYKPVDTDQYMFFDWVEGFVGHPFTSSPLGIQREAFLEEWKRGYDFSINELRKLLDLGSCFYWLAILIVRLREASASEPQLAKECLEEASMALEEFKDSFRELQQDVVENV